MQGYMGATPTTSQQQGAIRGLKYHALCLFWFQWNFFIRQDVAESSPAQCSISWGQLILYRLKGNAAPGLPPPDLGSFSGWNMTAHMCASSQSLRRRAEGESEPPHSWCSSHLKNGQIQARATTQRGKNVEYPLFSLSYSSLLPIIILHLKVVNFT